MEKKYRTYIKKGHIWSRDIYRERQTKQRYIQGVEIYIGSGNI